MVESLKHQAIKGVVWSAVERFSVQGIQFVLSIIIARLVAPSEYGLIAMLGIFLAIAQIFIDSGFSNALIQKNDRTDIDFNTVFYFSSVISIIVYGLLYLLAPFIALFYHEPLLVKLLRFIGLGLIISNISIIQRTKISISLNFKLLARVSLTSVVISGAIGIFMAIKGYGVWALAVQSFMNATFNTVFLFFFVRWHPSWSFSFSSFKILFSFGSKLLIGGLLHVIYTNLYTMVIGRKFTSAEVGLFNRAQTFSTFPAINVTDISSRPIYPLMCEIQDDGDKLRIAFLQYLRMMSYIIFPLMIGLSVLSTPFINLILTETWKGAAPLLSILCLSYMWYPVMNINWQILNVKGRSDLSLKSEIIKKTVAFIILFSTMPWGLEIMCWGLVLYSIIDIIIVIYFVRRVISVGYTAQATSILPTFVAALLMGGGVYLVVSLFSSSLLQLVIGILSGIVFYVLISILFNIPELRSITNIISKK